MVRGGGGMAASTACASPTPPACARTVPASPMGAAVVPDDSTFSASISSFSLLMAVVSGWGGWRHAQQTGPPVAQVSLHPAWQLQAHVPAQLASHVPQQL